MNEEAVIQQLRDSGADLVVSLPCEKNKLLTDMLHDEIRTIDITREGMPLGSVPEHHSLGRGLSSPYRAPVSATCSTS